MHQGHKANGMWRLLSVRPGSECESDELTHPHCVSLSVFETQQ